MWLGRVWVRPRRRRWGTMAADGVPARPVADRLPDRAEPRRVRRPRDQPRTRSGALGAPRRLLRASGPRRRRRDRHRGRLGAPVGLAARTRSARARVRPRLVGGGRGVPTPRDGRAGRARPRRGPGHLALVPARAVGAGSGPRGEHPRGPQGDGGRRHRGGRRRVRRRGATGSRCGLRRRRGQRRPVLPGAPVPVGVDQHPWRRVGRGPHAVRPSGAGRGARRGRCRPGRRAPSELRRARPLGRHHPRDGHRTRPRTRARRLRRPDRRPAHRRARLDLLRGRHPPRRPHRAGVQPGADPLDP